jgi:hypothetical protein
MNQLIKNLIILVGFALSNSALAVDRTCPQANAFLGKTMGEAKNVFNTEFASMWEINGPLSANGYTNLMTQSTANLCGKSTIVNKVIINGFADEANVLAVNYLLQGDITKFKPVTLVPLIGNEQIIETSEIPHLLSILYKNGIGSQLNFLTQSGSLFIHVSSLSESDKTMVSIYDLQELNNQQKELRASLKDFGFSE